MQTKAEMPPMGVQRIMDGFSTMDSIEEFEDIIKSFPGNPLIHRAYADLLARKKSFSAAAEAYQAAVKLFIDSGKTQQAIVTKIFEWQIAKPSQQEYNDFLSSLQGTGSRECPLQTFFARMACPEMMALMNGLALNRFPANTIVRKFGDPQEDLFFIISGKLKETFHFLLLEGKRDCKKLTKELKENIFFGEIYPFEKRESFQSVIETMTPVELIIISKERLIRVCETYPHVKDLVQELYKDRLAAWEEVPLNQEDRRESPRHFLPTRVTVQLFQKEGNAPPLVFDGFTEDISLGGACIILGERYLTGPASGMIGRNVKIRMNISTAAVKLHMLGTVVWSKEAAREGKTMTIVGIQFLEMSKREQDLLRDYCYGSEGEQNLIWSLMESVFKK